MKMQRMPNISVLLADLKKHGWHITAFPFFFNGIDYIVLFEDLDNLPSIPKENIDGKNRYSDFSVLLTFIDGSRELRTRANNFTCDLKAKMILDFFHIGLNSVEDKSTDIKLKIKNFYTKLSECTPKSVPMQHDSKTSQAIVKKLSESENESPDAIYCFMVRHNGERNGKKGTRSLFNSDKARILCPNLYKRLAPDKTISFCFRDHDPLTETEVLNRFAHNNQI